MSRKTCAQGPALCVKSAGKWGFGSRGGFWNHTSGELVTGAPAEPVVLGHPGRRGPRTEKPWLSQRALLSMAGLRPGQELLISKENGPWRAFSTWPFHLSGQYWVFSVPWPQTIWNCPVAHPAHIHWCSTSSDLDTTFSVLPWRPLPNPGTYSSHRGDVASHTQEGRRRLALMTRWQWACSLLGPSGVSATEPRARPRTAYSRPPQHLASLCGVPQASPCRGSKFRY